MEIDGNKPRYADAFLYDRRHDEPHRQGENGQDDEQGHHDAEYAVLQSALLLQEEDERINHVSQNPGDEEWQQHAGEAVDKQHDSRRNKGDYKEMRIISSHSISKGLIRINFDIDAAAYFVNAYMMQFPTALLKHDNKKHNAM